jgi:large subunit ribosomal protein L3
MRAGGHLGSDRVTVRNIEVLRVDAEQNILVVHGAVPGASGGYLVINKKA